MPSSTPKAGSAKDLDRSQVLEHNFFQFLQEYTHEVTAPQKTTLTAAQYLDLFDSQLTSRHLGTMARKLKQQGLGFYTIGSCGHECNAALGLAFRAADIAFLHYRSAAFMLQRAKTDPNNHMAYDMLLSLVASNQDPIACGRHKVFGSAALWVPPQMSTIASHLAKALGCAASIKRAQSLHIPHPLS